MPFKLQERRGQKGARVQLFEWFFSSSPFLQWHMSTLFSSLKKVDDVIYLILL